MIGLRVLEGAAFTEPKAFSPSAYQNCRLASPQLDIEGDPAVNLNDRHPLIGRRVAPSRAIALGHGGANAPRLVQLQVDEDEEATLSRDTGSPDQPPRTSASSTEIAGIAPPSWQSARTKGARPGLAVRPYAAQVPNAWTSPAP